MYCATALPGKLILLLYVLALSASATAETGLAGDWILNETRSAEVQPEQLESRRLLGQGRVSSSVSVGGIPIPGPGGGGKQKAFSDRPTKDPDILRCKRMQIEAAGEDLRMTYEEVGSELFRQGQYRGVTSSWNQRRLKSRYRTTTRKVTHDLQLQKDDSLLVTVTIKEDGSRKRTYKQIFERPGAQTEDPAAAAAGPAEAKAVGEHADADSDKSHL